MNILGIENKKKIEVSIEAIYKNVENKIQFFILGFFLLSILLAPIHETWVVAVSFGSAALVVYFIIRLFLSNTFLTRFVSTSFIILFCSLFLYQLHGLFYAHFFFFIAPLILLHYQSRTILIFFAIFVLLHHTLIVLFQINNYSDVWFADMSAITIVNMAYYFGFFIFHIILCGLWARFLNKNNILSINKEIAFESQVNNANKNIAFADNIASGNLDSNYDLEENDTIGRSLVNMRNKLKELSQKEEQQKWAAVGMARIGEILRVNTNNLEVLAYEVISTLVKYVKANQGGLFILNDDDQDDVHLVLEACYAYDKKKYVDKKIYVGQGLLGQCAMEKDTIYMTEIPDQYISITSGLGDANPSAILIVPLKVNDIMQGAMEIASFKEFQAYEIDFIEKVAESIASTISNTKINEKTKRLLEESQRMTEELRSNEEEMRQNLEELQATQEELRRRELQRQTQSESDE